jgi:hypothetical protein
MASSGKVRITCFTVIATAALVLAALLASTGQTSAGDGSKIIRGWVWDSAYRNVTDASIVVTVWEDSTKTNQRASLADTTDEDGFYSVWFGPSDWYVGDYIEVIATTNGKQTLNNTTATSSVPLPYQYINITYPFEIPEFGSAIGLILAGCAIGAVATVALVANQRKRVRT